MSKRGIHRLVYELKDRNELLSRDREQLALDYGLTVEELDLVLDGDLWGLHRLDVHPSIVTKVAMLHRMDLRTAFKEQAPH